MKKKAGFTLIELMIVVAIIAIIAAIAIPNLLRSRIQSNESATIGNLKALTGAQVSYHAAKSTYASTFAQMTGATPPFLEGDWTAVKQGYNYTLNTGTTTQWNCNADPANQGVTGNRYFYVDESGVIRWAEGGAADTSSPPIGSSS